MVLPFSRRVKRLDAVSYGSGALQGVPRPVQNVCWSTAFRLQKTRRGGDSNNGVVPYQVTRNLALSLPVSQKKPDLCRNRTEQHVQSPSSHVRSKAASEMVW
jgi:hypothetical protein